MQTMQNLTILHLNINITISSIVIGAVALEGYISFLGTKARNQNLIERGNNSPRVLFSTFTVILVEFESVARSSKSLELDMGI